MDGKKIAMVCDEHLIVRISMDLNLLFTFATDVIFLYYWICNNACVIGSF